MLTVDRIVQFSPLVRNLDEAMDGLHRFAGAFPSRRNRLDPTGVDIAIYPFGDETFMELVAPFEPNSAASRLLDRSGPGWFMINVDLQEAPIEEIDAAIEAIGARVVTRHIGVNGSGMWHIHPVDAAGVLLALYIREDRPDHTAWAGPTWRHFEMTNRRTFDSILGVSIATADIEAVTKLYTSFGFSFGESWDDAGDTVRQADCPGGTFLQVREPGHAGAPSHDWLQQHGEGLFHMALGTSRMDRVIEAMNDVNARQIRSTSGESGRTIWAVVDTAFGMPIEFREIQQ